MFSQTDNKCTLNCKSCKANETFKTCGNFCSEPTCSNPTSVGVFCTQQCQEGCFCNRGYVRNGVDGSCVLQNNCSSRELKLTFKTLREMPEKKLKLEQRWVDEVKKLLCNWTRLKAFIISSDERTGKYEKEKEGFDLFSKNFNKDKNSELLKVSSSDFQFNVNKNWLSSFIIGCLHFTFCAM